MPVWAESYNVLAARTEVGVMVGCEASIFSGSEEVVSAIYIGPRTRGVSGGPNTIYKGGK